MPALWNKYCTFAIMKKAIIIFSFCILPFAGYAQTETDNERIQTVNNSITTDFGEFLFDMASMLNADLLTLPVWNLGIFTLPTDENKGLKINPDAFTFKPQYTYMGNVSSSFTPSLYPSLTNNMNVQWQGASYKLNNGIRINTYGEYDSNGYKRVNPTAMPWQRNNFNAAFEMKSANGKFGIKVEVNAGRGY